MFALTWGALWQNSSSVREASVAPSTLKLSIGTEGNCNCRLAHCTQAATSAALQRLGSAIEQRKSDIILRSRQSKNAALKNKNFEESIINEISNYTNIRIL